MFHCRINIRDHDSGKESKSSKRMRYFIHILGLICIIDMLQCIILECCGCFLGSQLARVQDITLLTKLLLIFLFRAENVLVPTETTSKTISRLSHGHRLELYITAGKHSSRYLTLSFVSFFLGTPVEITKRDMPISSPSLSLMHQIILPSIFGTSCYTVCPLRTARTKVKYLLQPASSQDRTECELQSHSTDLLMQHQSTILDRPQQT